MSLRLMVRVFQLDIPPAKKLVLLAMAEHANNEGSSCYPSIARLMKETSLSRRSVQTLLRELEKAELLVRVGKARGGRSITTKYALNLDKTSVQNSAGRAPFPEPKRAQNLHEKGAKFDQKRECILIEPNTEPFGAVTFVGKSVEKASPNTAADVAVDSVSGVDRDVPGDSLSPVHHHRPPYTATPKKSDDDDSPAREKNNSRNGNSKATAKPSLKAQALAKFEAAHPNRVSRQHLEWALDAIESRSNGKPINSPNYFFKALENEFFETELEDDVNAEPKPARVEEFCSVCSHTKSFHGRMLENKLRFDPKWIEHEFTPETREIVETPKPKKQKPKKQSYDQTVSNFTDLLAKGGMSLESARAKVLELVNEEGQFDSWENCRTLSSFVRVKDIPGMPGPRENGQTVWMPETLSEFMALMEFASPPYCGLGAWNEACRYVSRQGKFASPEKRRALEDKLPILLQKKLAHDANEAKRERDRKRRRDRRAARKARNRNAHRNHGESEA